MENVFCYDTKIGNLTFVEKDGEIVRIEFGEKNIPDASIGESDCIKNAYKEICEYLEGKRKSFSIKINPQGTEFQKKVWNSLTQIPYGETRSYKDISIACENKNASRAVGMANNKNPIPIIIPCHRVIGADGSLTGYAGGLDMKTQLLKIESNYKND